MKAQPIRLLDVYFIGPLFFLAATGRPMAPWARAVMAAVGLLTIVYNGENYLRQAGLRDDDE